MMPESREPQSVIDRAEQALAAGDYASAEHFLREAARLTEAESGPLSPYLANTLNNLGVVSEMQNNADEAEVCYRKAYEIAAATLPADHPFVATSLKNLSDLCAAKGKPIDIVSPTLEVSRAEEPVVAIPPQPRIEKPEPSRRIPVAAFLLSVLLGAILAIVWLWPASNGAPAAETPPVSTQKPSEPAAAAQPPAAVNPLPAIEREPAAPTRASRGTAAASTSPAVITARLCRSLGVNPSSAADDWPCSAPASPIASGPVIFYTRLKAVRATTVEHRWYHGDSLYQSVELPISANQNRGFRTYSRYTIKDGSSGNWRVELRASDGTLLHQEQFVVR
jgi:DUF2914 family protein/tetratricopeptide repeat protein